MKTIKLLLLSLLLPGFLAAQEAVTLTQCQKWARENHPSLRQLEIYQQILDLKNQNSSTSYLPQVNLNGQATYQSEVTRIGISIPNITIPTVNKDQYKIYLDLKQSIWDGGLSKAQKNVNNAEAASNRQQTEVEMYQVRDKVNQYFFTSFLIQENLKILDKKIETINERKNILESAVNNGMAIASELDQLVAELINTKQQKIQLNTDLETVRYALAILTGKTAEQFQLLAPGAEPLALDKPLMRPELDWYSKQRALLETNSDLLKKQRNPKFFGFGQAGYGRPGLNMLSTEFKTYYSLGVGLSWNVFDWKTTQRQREVLKLQQDIVQTKQKSFEQSIDLATDQQQKQIQQLTELLKTDRELIDVRERITKTSSSKLENGTITSADYIQDLNAEITARISMQTHKIQLSQARVNLANIRGIQ
jgi:outer membrane protein TolC